jgi:hypothetical protein
MAAVPQVLWKLPPLCLEATSRLKDRFVHALQTLFQ